MSVYRSSSSSLVPFTEPLPRSNDPLRLLLDCDGEIGMRSQQRRPQYHP